MALTDIERAVLEAYRQEEENDPEGAFNPYYHSIAKAAGNNADLAYAACKALKKAKLIECSGRQGASLLSAPAYWITEAGKEALVVP